MKIVELKFTDIKDAMSGVSAISIVEDPAIEENFLKFSKTDKNKEEVRKTVMFSNEAKRELIGPVMIPDKLMFRSAKQMGNDEGAYVFFSRGTIGELAGKYLKFGSNNNITLDHSEQIYDNEKIYMMESWVVEDENNDKIYSFEKYDNTNVPLGTWCVKMKVEDEELWNYLKGKGFSVEMFSSSLEQIEFEQELTPYEKILRIIEEKNRIYNYRI